MKSTLTLLSLLFFTNIVGQENYLYIENKGNTKCFFDESDPLSFLNMCKNDFVQNTTYLNGIGYYESKLYPDLEMLSTWGRPETILIVDMFGATNEEILVRDPSSNQNFQEWFDSIVQMNTSPEESELMLLDDMQKADLEKRWIKAGQGGSGFIYKSNYNLYYSFKNIKAILIDQEYNAFFIKHKQRVSNNEIINEPYISAAMKIPNEFSTGIGVQLNKSETKELWENMRNLKLYGKETPDLEDEVRYHSHLDDSLFSLKDSYFALSHRIYSIQNESYSEFNFGTKYFDTIVGGPETILIVDMFGATNEEILVRDPSSNMDFQGWFDSIVQLNYPPEESDLMLFDAKQKADLHLRWIEARANVNGFIQRPNEVVLKWWDFPNPSAHAIGSYYLSLYPTDGESDSDCTFEHLVWSIDNENIRFPVMSISNIELQEKTVEKFQKSTKTLKWVDLLLSEKAGKIIPKSEMDEKKFDQLTGGLIKELIFNP
jgi:hypothetical protein